MLGLFKKLLDMITARAVEALRFSNITVAGFGTRRLDSESDQVTIGSGFRCF